MIKQINFLILMILIIFNISILAQTQDKTLESYLGKIDDFNSLLGDDKSQLWDQSKNLGTEGKIIREAIINKLTEKISSEKIKVPEYEKAIFGGETEITKIEKVINFDDSSLSFSEKGKNIIGNPKTNLWLDLDQIPININEIEYKKGKFILRAKSGGELIITPESINEKGELNLVGSYTEGPNKDKKISLSDLTFVGTKKDNAKIILTKNEIQLEGNTELLFGKLKFKTAPDFPKTISSSLKILSDKDFIVYGVDVIKEGVVKVNALYKGDKLTDVLWPETHVTLGETKPQKENYVKINDNNIETKGKGSLEVLGALGKLEIDGDFFIKNGDMKLRVKDNEIFGPRKGQFLNRDDYLTEISLRDFQTLSVAGAISKKLLDFKINNGKIIGIRKAGESEFIELNNPSQLSKLKKEMPKMKSLIDNIVASKGNLNVFRRSLHTPSTLSLAEKHNFPEQEVFTGENTFGIDELKSTSSDKSFAVVNKNGKYVFEDDPYFRLGDSNYGTINIVPNNYARTFEGIKKNEEMIRKLSKSEFLMIRKLPSFAPKETPFGGVINKLRDAINEMDSSITSNQRTGFVNFITNEVNKLPDLGDAKMISYWHPERNSKIDIELSNGKKISINIPNERKDAYRDLLIHGSKKILNNKDDEIAAWCQSIGEKIDRYCNKKNN